MLQELGLPKLAARAFPAGLALLACSACATYVDDSPPANSAGGVSGGGAGGLSVSGAGGGLPASGGVVGAGGKPTVGAGGLAGAGGQASSAAGAGGKGGTGGGGTGGGGTGGGGTGGGGGIGNQACSAHPTTAKSAWVVTASHSHEVDVTPRAHDGMMATRWASGKDQSGDEWLQIDFGTDVTLTKATLVQGGTSGNDYPRTYTTRFSNSSMNFAAPALLTGAGQANVDTAMTFSPARTGRYLLISQGGSAPTWWWTVAEIEVECAN